VKPDGGLPGIKRIDTLTGRTNHMIEISPDTTDAMSGIASTISIGSGGDNTVTEVIAIMIPIVAIVFGIGIGMLSMYLDYRKKREFSQLHHKERLAAIDKGMEVPPLPPEFFQDPRRRRTSADYLRRGLVWLFVGAAITVALYYQHGHAALWGLVPAAAGLGNLIFYFVQGRQPRIPDDPSNPTR
jgi:uncharacterized membrane protein YoaK (UPF0700 family)